MRVNMIEFCNIIITSHVMTYVLSRKGLSNLTIEFEGGLKNADHMLSRSN